MIAIHTISTYNNSFISNTYNTISTTTIHTIQSVQIRIHTVQSVHTIIVVFRIVLQYNTYNNNYCSQDPGSAQGVEDNLLRTQALYERQEGLNNIYIYIDMYVYIYIYICISRC